MTPNPDLPRRDELAYWCGLGFRVGFVCLVTFVFACLVGVLLYDY